MVAPLEPLVSPQFLSAVSCLTVCVCLCLCLSDCVYLSVCLFALLLSLSLCLHACFTFIPRHLAGKSTTLLSRQLHLNCCSSSCKRAHHAHCHSFSSDLLLFLTCNIPFSMSCKQQPKPHLQPILLCSTCVIVGYIMFMWTGYGWLSCRLLLSPLQAFRVTLAGF